MGYDNAISDGSQHFIIIIFFLVIRLAGYVSLEIRGMQAGLHVEQHQKFSPTVCAGVATYCSEEQTLHFLK